MFPLYIGIALAFARRSSSAISAKGLKRSLALAFSPLKPDRKCACDAEVGRRAGEAGTDGDIEQRAITDEE